MNNISCMQKMKCGICGHIYDPDTGDIDAPAGTEFSTLPDTWKCPVCLASKKMFSPV